MTRYTGDLYKTNDHVRHHTGVYKSLLSSLGSCIEHLVLPCHIRCYICLLRATFRTPTLDTVNNLCVLYADEGKMAGAEMYMLVLEGYEKAWGHTSTLNLEFLRLWRYCPFALRDGSQAASVIQEIEKRRTNPE